MKRIKHVHSLGARAHIGFIACAAFVCTLASFVALYKIVGAQNNSPLVNFGVSTKDLISQSQPQIGTLPIAFEPNVGQFPKQVAFSGARGASRYIFTGNGLMMKRETGSEEKTEARMVGMEFLKGKSSAAIEGVAKIQAVSNYFYGTDQSKWKTAIPNFQGVSYKKIYNGIDAEFLANPESVMLRFTVSPNADPKDIALALKGVEKVELEDNATSFRATTELGDVSWKNMIAFQDEDGLRKAVPAKFTLDKKNVIRFQIGKYNKNVPLIIDPMLSLAWSTFLGGSADEFTGGDTAMDSAGNIVVSSTTSSANFPTANPYQGTFGGTRDATVTKLNGDGTAILWSTFLGGGANESATGLALDSLDNVYVFGFTNATGYPLMNAYQGTFNGANDITLTKLAADGASLVYSTYFGGTGVDISTSGLIVDAAGNATMVGRTSSSTNFPLANAAQPVYGGGTQDMFVAQFNAVGNLNWSTFLGGSLADNAANLALDNLGDIVVTGTTNSTDFPTLNPFQATNGGGYDGLMAKYTSLGAKVWATYLGGTGTDQVISVAIGPTGNITAYGVTASSNFPVVNALQPTHAGGTYDLFFSRFNSAGNIMSWSTFLGGTGNDSTASSGVAVDALDNVYYIGRTNSTDFPMVQAYQATNAGSFDVNIGKLSFDGQVLGFSSYLGGSGAEVPSGLTLVGTSAMIFTGQTPSSNFPTTAGVVQPTYGGGTNDNFVVRLALGSSFSVFHPNGFEKFRKNQPIFINWVSQSIPADTLLDIDYITNVGKTIAPIAKNIRVGSKGIHWNPPRFNAPVTQVKIRLTLRDSQGRVILVDQSDNFFKIESDPGRNSWDRIRE